MCKTLKAPFWAVVFCFVFAFGLTRNARANLNLVQDGDFTNVTYSGTLALSGTLYGQFGAGTGSTLTVAGWSTTGYNFVYTPAVISSGSHGIGANPGTPNEAPGQFNNSAGYGTTYLWGPGNGSANGGITASPAGGNIVAMDGAFETGAITQTITGLQAGRLYELTFYWAGAQQDSFTGSTTDAMMVTLGTESFTTGTLNVASEGWTGWNSGTFVYTATGTSETLSFLAIGTPNGEPPFALLSGIDLELVPDFSNWLVFIGFGTVCITFEMMRRRRRRLRETGPGSGSKTASLFSDTAGLPGSE